MMDILTNPDEMLEKMLNSLGADSVAEGGAALETGRRIITFNPDAIAQGRASLNDLAPGSIASSSDFDGDDITAEGLSGASGLVFEELGVAILDEASGMAASSFGDGSSATAAFSANEPEIFMFPAGVDPAEYLRGFAAAAARIRDDLAAGGGGGGGEGEGADDPASAVLGNTWGIVAVRANTSRFTGRGIKIAILDTGFDFRHPDFAGRAIVHRSFISGETTQDVNGHGTHCTGTAAGPRAPAGNIPRYGVAFEANIFIGKVLSNTGGGTSASVLAGMNWAIANRCEVISMSLGGGGGPYAYYTQAGQQALNAGCLIIAAAGNSSNRPGTISPCGAPANSPTIMACAALDPNLGVAYYSNGGPIQIAAPGSSVFSSVPMPTRYGPKTGTSMATPHAAGCAALLAQATGLRGNALRAALRARARPLPLPVTAVGSGLVQAVQ
ncbi:S8 family serine peptidase [Sandarakinorhabdus sp.]|uniref:S8 family serine peptidase n=1 Tax=Sandarakinorhabdus sp. TaxID=1916663 RepID=UPI00333F3BE5